MSHKKLRPFIVKVSVLGYFPLLLVGISINILLHYDNGKEKIPPFPNFLITFDNNRI